MSQPPQQHRSDAPDSLRVAVVTISDTRTDQTDRGGATIVGLLEASGHTIAHRQIVPDDPDHIGPLVEALCGRPDVDAVLLTGGTGIASRDRTYETLVGRLDTPLPGYGELFRALSYHEIGAAAMLSRAVGGLIDRTVVLTMPGSQGGVRLAMEKIILPELGHLVREARR